jgi:hypothetical protein
MRVLKRILACSLVLAFCALEAKVFRFAICIRRKSGNFGRHSVLVMSECAIRVFTWPTIVATKIQRQRKH